MIYFHIKTNQIVNLIEAHLKSLTRIENVNF